MRLKNEIKNKIESYPIPAFKDQKRLSGFKTSPTSVEMGGNRDFYATLRFAYLRVVKRLKMVQ